MTTPTRAQRAATPSTTVSRPAGSPARNRTVLVYLPPGDVAATLQCLTRHLWPIVRVTTTGRDAAACQAHNPADVLLVTAELTGTVAAPAGEGQQSTIVVDTSDPTLLPPLVAGITGLPLTTPAAERPALTAIEWEILHYAADGLTDDAIAERLSLPISTINNRMRRILRSTMAPSRTAAVAAALRNGWIE